MFTVLQQIPLQKVLQQILGNNTTTNIKFRFQLLNLTIFFSSTSLPCWDPFRHQLQKARVPTEGSPRAAVAINIGSPQRRPRRTALGDAWSMTRTGRGIGSTLTVFSRMDNVVRPLTLSSQLQMQSLTLNPCFDYVQ
uniref:Uncharacterized protein n=1 Tax=Setaria italica TaxID=4555 RepID=K3ZE17_SETIT